jgi:hypothetical protein
MSVDQETFAAIDFADSRIHYLTRVPEILLLVLWKSR